MKEKASLLKIFYLLLDYFIYFNYFIFNQRNKHSLEMIGLWASIKPIEVSNPQYGLNLLIPF